MEEKLSRLSADLSCRPGQHFFAQPPQVLLLKKVGAGNQCSTAGNQRRC